MTCYDDPYRFRRIMTKTIQLIIGLLVNLDDQINMHSFGHELKLKYHIHYGRGMK